ncbi:hypothetical protein REPUB_Repub04eG0054700 [Reevesia pubescens]
MHIAEKGEGPVVLLIHGFPQLWSSWKYQINHLAHHGFHVVAPDMRGYGDSSDCPKNPASFTLLHLVGDLIGLLDDLGEKQAFVVGHDWGAQVAWHLCLFRPDRVRALVNLSVPYFPRAPNIKPIKFMTQIFGEGFYISQFQKFLFINAPDLLAAPPGVEIVDFLENPPSLPDWITQEDLELQATKFQKSGFTGALNYYRAMDMNWELLGPWQGSKITVPTKFIVGNKDTGFQSFGTKDYIQGEEFRSLVPDLEVLVIDGHHFIQQEKAEQVTTEILSFFRNKISCDQ